MVSRQELLRSHRIHRIYLSYASYVIQLLRDSLKIVHGAQFDFELFMVKLQLLAVAPFTNMV